jgi:integrase/recombinase XerD
MQSLYEANDERKYLNKDEWAAFLKAAEHVKRQLRTFCGVLAYTDCRISEALALTADWVDLASGAAVFESLKKRKKGVYRAVPAPPALLAALDLVHGICQTQKGKNGGRKDRLWV